MTLQNITSDAANDWLDQINAVIAEAIRQWDLPARLHRLSVTTYSYTASDWLDHRFDAIIVDDSVQGILVTTDMPSTESTEIEISKVIHGLYVASHHQGKGLGRQMLSHALSFAQQDDCDGCYVKAHATAVGFFEEHGFTRLAVNDPERDYPYRLFRSVKRAVGSNR